MKKRVEPHFRPAQARAFVARPPDLSPRTDTGRTPVQPRAGMANYSAGPKRGAEPGVEAEDRGCWRALPLGHEDEEEEGTVFRPQDFDELARLEPLDFDRPPRLSGQVYDPDPDPEDEIEDQDR